MSREVRKVLKFLCGAAFGAAGLAATAIFYPEVMVGVLVGAVVLGVVLSAFCLVGRAATGDR